ncbi:hypothetical protein GCK32_012570, partial [Trichostrongylus colubriformis]
AISGLNASEDRNKLEISQELASTTIYNPLWAIDEPHLSTNLRTKCVALDLRSEATAGWRLLDCVERLPILCETFACMGDEFRCRDNTRCIPRNAVNDGIVDCADGSDERTPVISKLSNVEQEDRRYSQPFQNNCQNIVLTLSEGTITSPNYPRNYSERTTCQWYIRAQPGQILVFNVEYVALTAADTLWLEGDQEGDKLSLGSSPYPLSYISNSSQVHLRFSSDPANVCRVVANSVTYESWRENYDCVYTLQSPDRSSSILLEIHPSSMGERTTAIALFDNVIHRIDNARTTQILVIPSSSVRLEVRNAWLSERHTAMSITYRYIGIEPLELPLNLDGFTFHWFPSKNGCCFPHTVRLSIHSTERFLPHTLTVAGILSNRDAVTMIKDGAVTRVGSPSTFRAHDLHGLLHVLITKRSAGFQLSLKFSKG